MSKALAIAAICCVAAIAPLAWAGGSGGPPVGPADDVVIHISPATLNLAAPCEWVTVHTNLPYSAVDLDSLALDGVPAAWTKVDDRGQLVVKVAFDEVAALVAPPSATLTLTGSLLDGTPFSAADTIAVIDPQADE